jgi:hypothetical protein
MPRTADFDRKRLMDVFDRQHGVISREQALETGMTARVLRYRIRGGGPWQLLVPGVYLNHTGTATVDQRDMAALLYAGPRSVLTGPAALRRFDLNAARLSQVDVLVPMAVQRRGAGFARIRRTSRLPEMICVAGEIRYALAARAVADTARSLTSLAEVRAVVAEAVQRNRCPISQLKEELGAGPTRGSARLRQALAEVADGVRSVAEADLRALIRSARLPAPLYNPRLFAGQVFLGVPDCWWPDYGVALEVDSRAWHFSPRAWQDTLARDARMGAHGIIVLHFTPAQIRTEPAVVIATIRDAIKRGHPQRHIRTLPAA